MNLSDLVEEKYKQPNYGAAHLNPRDAYRDVPVLKQPTWNNEVAAYFFFGGISAGAALLGSLAEVVGGERRDRLAHTAQYVSFVTLLPCPPLLIADLGTPQRFHHMLRIFKPSSPMNLGSWALLVHGVGATVTIMEILAHDGKLPLVGWLVRLWPERLMMGLALPSSFVLAGYTGVLLGTTSIPVWYTSPLLGALFMSGSLASGAAAVSLATTLTGRGAYEDHRTLASLELTLGAAEMAVLGGYVITSGEAGRPLFQGSDRIMIAGAIAALGSALVFDVISLALGKQGKVAGLLASASALAGGAMLRWAIVRAGRLSAADREGTLDAMKPRKGAPGWGRQRTMDDRR